MEIQMQKILESINLNTFSDYSSNYCSNECIRTFKNEVNERLGIILDKDFLLFLKNLNGFELNGLNLYGTKEISNKYVLSSIKQNVFWRNEIKKLTNFYLIGDGDMDFYGYSNETKKYVVLTKATIEKVDEFDDFISFISYLIEIYS